MSGLILMFTPLLLCAASVTFTIENLKSDQGLVLIGIYDSAEAFPKKGKHVTGCVSRGKISGKSVSITCDVEPGIYAAAAFHDENGNDDLDTSLVGIPKERYGFSNNAKGFLGPPGFEKAAFKVGRDDIKMNIRLIE